MNFPEHQMTTTAIISRLEKLTQQPGFIYILAMLVQKHLLIDVSEIHQINWRERISFQEFGFLIGLMVKSPLNMTLPSETQAQETFSEVYELFEKLHDTHMNYFIEKMKEMDLDNFSEISDEGKEEFFSDLFASGEMMTEPIFYAGSGGYDFQYREFALKKYASDIQWLQDNKHFPFEVAVGTSTFLKKLSESKYNALVNPSSFENYCEQIFNVFCFTKLELNLNLDQASNFLNAFSLIPGQVNQHFAQVGQYNAALSHPIIKLGDDQYFMPIQFHLAQSIYESPFYWMLQDSEYKSEALSNRGKSTEDIAFDILSPVFGVNLFKDIKVKRVKAETVTDIDILAVTGNKAIVIQAKSKRLTELSRRGNTEQLKKDFSDAIQKAYEQGIACRDAILSRQSKFLKVDGTEINLEETIDDVYIICLMSDEYPALVNQVNAYLAKAKQDPFPIAINLFDLDILAFYLKDPFEFLYYVRQRINLTEYIKASSEMVFLGFHLKQKLFLKGNDMLALDESYAQLIDANFPVLRGHHPQTESVEVLHHKWKNKMFEKLIQAVKETQNPGLTDAIFYLFDLAGDGADRLMKAINDTQRKTRSDKKNHDFSMIFDNGKSGISFVTQYDNSSSDISERLLHLSIIRKYKTRANEWLGLGRVLMDNRMLTTIVFNKTPWVFDEDLEELSSVSLTKATRVNKNWEKIKRNDPCPCGSGKKYKKCCGS